MVFLIKIINCLTASSGESTILIKSKSSLLILFSSFNKTSFIQFIKPDQNFLPTKNYWEFTRFFSLN